MGDWQGLAENQTKGTTLHGANAFEKATVIAGKLIHYSIIAVIPALLHGLPAAALGGTAYMATQVCSPCRTALTAACQEAFIALLAEHLFITVACQVAPVAILPALPCSSHYAPL